MSRAFAHSGTRVRTWLAIDQVPLARYRAWVREFAEEATTLGRRPDNIDHTGVCDA